MMEEPRYIQLKKRAGQYLFDFGVPVVIGHIRQYCREEIVKVIREADLLLKQTFVFEDTWDMEPCSRAYTFKAMIWDQSPNGDPEWIYMLNRHGFLQKLLMAYYLSGKEEYMQKLKFYIMDWIRQNPVTKKGGETIRTIDTGIRCMNWTIPILHLVGEGFLDEQETEWILKSMDEQLKYLKKMYIGKYSLSNWGVLQTTSICQNNIWFPEYLTDSGLVGWAWEELFEQLELQILEDGSHWEQSIMYHMEVLNVCTRLLYLCQRAGIKDKTWLAKKVDAMSRYVLYAAAPDHCQIAQGDSDVSDVRDVLTKSAVVCSEGVFKYGGFTKADLDSAFMLGAEGILCYERIEAEKPKTLCMAYPDTGNIYLRSSWREDGNFTYLQNGPLGSSHGHVDLTHISVHYKGKPVLVDSGRYSYVEEEPLRPYLKSGEAHNICIIDGEPHGVPIGSWGYGSYGDCLKNYVSGEGPLHYVEMAYHGKLKDGSCYLVKRKVLHLDMGIWLIVNEICCAGRHEVKEYYHLDDQVKAESWGIPVSGDEVGGGFRLISGEDVLRLTGSKEFSLEDCIISKRYNQKTDSHVLIKTSNWEGALTDFTCLAAEDIRIRAVPVLQYGNPHPLGKDFVTAVEFCISARESWVFILFHQEVYRGGKVMYCKDIPLYGKTCALHLKDGSWERIRLRN